MESLILFYAKQLSDAVKNKKNERWIVHRKDRVDDPVDWRGKNATGVFSCIWV